MPQSGQALLLYNVGQFRKRKCVLPASRGNKQSEGDIAIQRYSDTDAN